MTVFKTKPKGAAITREEALNHVPVKNVAMAETRLENGDVLLNYPARMRPLVAGVVTFFGGRADRGYAKKLQLDSLGVQVWEMIDGNRTVRQIVHRFADAHRLHSREAEVSVTAFLRELGKRGLIGLR
jgi:hypothetical protein